MFGKHITVKDVTAVISLYHKVMTPPGEYDPAQMEPIAYGFGMMAKAAKGADEANQIFDKIDMGYLYFEGKKAYLKHVKEVIQKAKKKRS